MGAKKSEDFKSMSDEKFTYKEKQILKKNKKFFSTDRKYVEEMLKIINGESDISIRVLDWFVANYSKKYNTVYKIKINGIESFFNVNIEYKNQLNGYSKLYFDPFCRRKKVIYSYKNNDGKKNINFVSSIGQLNFFQWAIRNKVIKYVQIHLEEIENDMKETSKRNKEKKLAAIHQDESSTASIIKQERNDKPDPVICSSDKINSVHISPFRKSSNSKSDSEGRCKRQQLSKSVFDNGIKKSNIPIKLDFE